MKTTAVIHQHSSQKQQQDEKGLDDADDIMDITDTDTKGSKMLTTAGINTFYVPPALSQLHPRKRLTEVEILHRDAAAKYSALAGTRQQTMM
jgi:hypothetical protein